MAFAKIYVQSKNGNEEDRAVEEIVVGTKIRHVSYLTSDGENQASDDGD